LVQQSQYQRKIYRYPIFDLGIFGENLFSRYDLYSSRLLDDFLGVSGT
jgi:hypothetical protein